LCDAVTPPVYKITFQHGSLARVRPVAVERYPTFESLTPATGERQSDIGVSLTVKLKRGTGTRDQDEVIAKAKGKTLEDAREDMQTLREYIHGLTDDARQIQPADPHEK